MKTGKNVVRCGIVSVLAVTACCMLFLLCGQLAHKPCPPDSYKIADLLPKSRFIIDTDTRAYVKADPDDSASVRLIRKDAGGKIHLVMGGFGSTVMTFTFAGDVDIATEPLRRIKTEEGKIVLGETQNLIIQDWFDGAEHVFLGDVRLGSYRFQSDSLFPLTFKVVKDSGYVYLCGRGKVQKDKANPVELGKRQAASDWIVALTTGNALQKEGASQALGRYKDKKAVPALIIAVKDTSSWRLRRDAAEALGRIGDASAVEALAAATSDKNEWVGKVAMEALARIGSPGLPHIKKSLASKEDDVRETAIYALGASPSEEAVAILAEIVKGKDAGEREKAVCSLGKIKKPSSLPLLLNALKSDTESDVRKEAVDAIAAIGGPESTTAILAALNDKVEDVRQRVVSALAKSTDPRSLPALELAAAKDKSPDVRKAAKEAVNKRKKSSK